MALARWRDRVLANARVQPGDTVLDVGTGDGLVGLGALALAGENGHVVFSDVSPALLAACRRAVHASGLAGRTSFVLAPAEDLTGVDPGSVDVVTTRSVLMHVTARPEAFREFHRVLRPGGRLACFESVASRLQEPPGLYRGYDISPIREVVDRLRAHGGRGAPLATAPMLDFDDTDLVRWAEEAGFIHVHLTLEVDVARPSPMRSWEFFYRTSTHPGIPSLADEADAALTVAEKQELCAHLRPLVESGAGVKRQAICYLTATK